MSERPPWQDEWEALRQRDVEALVRFIGRWPNARHDVAMAMLGEAIGTADMMGIDVEAFLVHLRKTHPKPSPIVPRSS